MAWIIPENKLDPQQRNFLESVDLTKRNIWIKGFAGSGKSVLLMYALKKIKARFPNSNVILIVFTQSLVEMFRAALKELNLHAEVDTYYSFMKGARKYDYILCDEVQDLTPRIIHEMKRRGNHIVVAGDSNQSIYESDPRWRETTVSPSEIGSLINGGVFELNIIHRLSKSIIDAVQRFLPNMNIFSAKRDMTHSDTQIRMCEAKSEAQEVEYILNQGEKAVNQGYTSAVLLPSAQSIIKFVNLALKAKGKSEWHITLNQWGKPDFGAMNRYLISNGIKLQYIGNGYGSFDEGDKRIVIMTFHSAKGLDFDNIFIPFANNSMYISPNEGLAKTLFMVAMTRSRENLYISYYGYKSDYLSAFSSNCSNIDITNALAGTTTQTRATGNVWGF